MALPGWPAWDDRWYGGASYPNASGGDLTADTAMRASTVFACVRVLAETVGSLPLPLYEDLGEGGRRRAKEQGLYSVLHDRPNEWQTSQEWREMLTGHVALRGNGYCYIKSGPRGFVDQLIPMHPDRVKPELLPTNRMRYRYRTPEGTDTFYSQDEIFHLRGLSSDGISGLSVIGLMREAAALSLTLETYAARAISQGVRPSGVLEHPGALKNTEIAKRLRDQWNETYAGAANTGKTLILEEGMKWSQIGMSLLDAQFLEQRKYQVTEIARIFRIPAHLVGDLERATFSNIEQQSLEFVMYTMMPWFVRWEQVIARDLIVDPSRYYAKFLVDALLRADTKSRYEAYAIGRNWGWLSADDIREKEEMNPLPGGLGKIYLQPGNMTPAGQFTQVTPVGGGASAVSDHLALVARDAAARLVRKEIAAVTRAARHYADDSAGWSAWLDEFYGALPAEVCERLRLSEEDGRAYALSQKRSLSVNGIAIMEDWELTSVEDLAALMLQTDNDPRVQSREAWKIERDGNGRLIGLERR